MVEPMYAVYVIQHTVTRECYIGHTNNLRRRLSEHNRGLQTSTRRTLGTWIYIYIEIYRSERDVIEREHKLKQHGSNKRWLKNRIKHSLLPKKDHKNKNKENEG
jgi:predicted GIY-YIG superfamily endonuclease